MHESASEKRALCAAFPASSSVPSTRKSAADNQKVARCVFVISPLFTARRKPTLAAEDQQLVIKKRRAARLLPCPLPC